MPPVTVRPFRRSDRDQLTHLVNSHAQCVVPGVSISVNAVLSQLEHEPGEFIVEPWVHERATLVAEQRGRITAAAYLVRYRTDTAVGDALRGAGEIRWLLQWPDASFWPDASAAGQAVGEAALDLMRTWQVHHVLADATLPAPGLTGVPEQWPHLRELLGRLGFVSYHSEHVLLAETVALPAQNRADLRITRTLGECGTRFTAATAAGRQLGYVEVDTSVSGAGRRAPIGWADIGNLHVAEHHRRQGIGTALIASAADWLRLARTDRLLAYAEPAETELVAFLERTGFVRLTTCTRHRLHVDDVA